MTWIAAHNTDGETRDIAKIFAQVMPVVAGVACLGMAADFLCRLFEQDVAKALGRPLTDYDRRLSMVEFRCRQVYD